MPPEESLTIRPPAAEWRTLVRQNRSAEAAEFRRQLGLPTDRPVIMTGHQAEFWHPGILAKYLAADAAAGALGAAPAWLVVDQDRAESLEIAYPGRGRDGHAERGVIRVERGRASATASRAATVRERGKGDGETVPPLALVEPGLAAIRASLARHADEATLARQVSAALADLLNPLLTHRSPRTIFATDLHMTSLFASLVSRMRDDPDRVIRAYNAAAAAHPTTGIRPLVMDEVQYRYELPLWHLPPGRPRERVYAEMLEGIPLAELAPKALLMTGLVRLAGCDLFIHGTGGGGGSGAGDEHEGYDLVTEDWLTAWLGIPRSALAPIATVTATRCLPLDVPPPPAPAAVARALWLAHSARHNPGRIGDGADEARKRELVARVAAAADADRHRCFRELHAFLDSYRAGHASELARLEAAALAAAAHALDPDLRTVRTWPFPLYPAPVLAEVRDQIAAAFAT